ncbi:Butyrophilin subfamily 2 member A1 [Tupaia chinensis]|uniref:Butyrophilin subfamily 2 member A1 n=1 Tax=Tupaia chinensis TaxID=246437 RepID=L8YB81_TUPCH|nr:Butyrophilin subfamily 2 member A1 [Tupaia chinensis]
MAPAASLHSPRPASRLLLPLLSLTALGSAQFTVLGPRPVLAMLGENSTLRCRLSPEKDATAMEVRWFRARFSPAVLVYKGARERAEEQMEQYRGRTSFLGDDLGRGRAALVLHRVTAPDDGLYHCYFQEGRSYDQAVARLVVAGLGSTPLIEMKGREDGAVWLECTSAGWYPEPRVLWRGPDGEVVPALEEVSTAGADGLFTITTAVLVTDGTMRNVTCVVSNPLLGQEKDAVIFIPESLVPSGAPWTVALAAILPTLTLLLASGICVIQKLHRDGKSQSAGEEVGRGERETTPPQNCEPKPKARKEGHSTARPIQVPTALRSGRKARPVLCSTDPPPCPPQPQPSSAPFPEQLQEELRPQMGPCTEEGPGRRRGAGAHPELFLSQDRRSVRRGPGRRRVPDTPQRFDCRPCVLGRDRFWAGKHCWEVAVGGAMVWAVGVCRDSADRKGEAPLSPQNGFWTLELFSRQSPAPERVLPVRGRLRRVALFLDCDAGDVSFYDARDRSHLYTCPRAVFAGPLRPLLRLGSDDSPLRVCPAFAGAAGAAVPEGGLVMLGAGTGRPQDRFPGVAAL